MKRLLDQMWIVIAVLVGAFALSWVIYMPTADQRGVWRADAGGRILTLTPFQAALYSETSVFCVHQLGFPAHLKLVELAEGLTITGEGDTLTLQLDTALDPITFSRLAALPPTCGDADPDAAPSVVFNAMWTAMRDHYAFFDLHDMDWDARRALVPEDAQLSDAALFATLTDALTGLDDGHIQLSTPLGTFSPASPPAWVRGTAPLNPAPLWQAARDEVGTGLLRVERTGIEYALLPDQIGYVMIRGVALDTPFGAKDLSAMAIAFSQVADALASAAMIILDLRYAAGGSDSAAFGIASHFTATPIDVLTKTTRTADGQTAPFTATVMPFDATPLDQSVIVLTTAMTAAAAEVLTLSLRDLPNVTVMGEATAGQFSDILAVKLPNGWGLGVPNQTYRAATETSLAGTSLAGIGLVPDLPFVIDGQALAQGDDRLLQAAIARAQGD